MQLLSCSNPKRVFNKYTGEYVYVPCGECSICKNKRAAHYTQLLERERSQHAISFFVTLTYDELNLPIVSFGQRVPDYADHSDRLDRYVYTCSRERDCDCIPFSDLFPPDKKDDYTLSDLLYFGRYVRYGGLPYASKSDIQLFLKRLNKYIHDKITYQYKNFRYFVVSEYGSTTFRPHFHAIFFIDNRRLIDEFENCIAACWKFGIYDCKPVESSACAYVSQYINKSSDLPYVYRNKQISPFFLCSRNPFIGALSERPENDKEIIMSVSPTTFGKRKPSDIQFSQLPLQPSYQNRLFPKCPSYSSLSDSLRIRFYSAYSRYGKTSLKEFLNLIVYKIIAGRCDEFFSYLRSILVIDYSAGYKQLASTFNAWKLLDDYSFNYLRRMYYVGRKLSRQACLFGITLKVYIAKIIQYYDYKKPQYLLSQQYEYQENLSQSDSDSIAAMYLDFLRDMGFSLRSYLHEISSTVGLTQIHDADYFDFCNKKTHFKNAYLDSLQLKESSIFLYNLIKCYLYGKKCNETIEALAT